jgi:hypothetical protein
MVQQEISGGITLRRAAARYLAAARAGVAAEPTPQQPFKF